MSKNQNKKLNQITFKEASVLVTRCFKKKIVPYLAGSPGIGKSALGMHLAKKFECVYIDVRLAQADPTDLNGFPAIIDGVATFIPFDTFPTKGTPIPKGKKGWIINLDELSSCPKAIQAAAYKIVLDRQVGNRDLHENVSIMAAGNLSTDGAVVHKMSTALASRMSHLYVKADLESWMAWAMNEGKVDPRVLAFLRYKPELLHSFDPKVIEDTFPCPRTWEHLSKLIEDDEKVGDYLAPLINGTVGAGTGIAFKAFCSIEVPTIDQICKNPLGIAIPSGQGPKYFLTCHVAQYMNFDNATELMQFLARLPIEMQVIAILTAYRKQATLVDHPDVDAWLDVNAQRFQS